MRKTLLTLAALAAVGVATPVATSAANAETVIVRHGHGWHHGWWHRHDGWHHRYGWYGHRHYGWHRGATVVVR